LGREKKVVLQILLDLQLLEEIQNRRHKDETPSNAARNKPSSVDEATLERQPEQTQQLRLCYSQTLGPFMNRKGRSSCLCIRSKEQQVKGHAPDGTP